MPETAVHKHRHLLLSESKVRPPRDRQVPSPAPYAGLPHNLGQLDFCLLVALAPDPGHHLGPLTFRPNIGHKADVIESRLKTV